MRAVAQIKVAGWAGSRILCAGSVLFGADSSAADRAMCFKQVAAFCVHWPHPPSPNVRFPLFPYAVIRRRFFIFVRRAAFSLFRFLVCTHTPNLSLSLSLFLFLFSYTFCSLVDNEQLQHYDSSSSSWLVAAVGQFFAHL